MPQRDDSQKDSVGSDIARPESQRERHAGHYEPKDLNIFVAPGARYRKRTDGGMDESFRIQFVKPLTEQHMRAIAKLLLAMPDEAAEYGFTALTKLEFLEPDVCDYRFWCARFHSDRLVATWGLWLRIHKDVCSIYAVDGVRYSFLLKPEAQP